MTASELRKKYIAFFESKGHHVFSSSPLIPYDVTNRLDESLLFTGAGMVQFKPFFRGIAKPPHPRLITAQKCVRTGDIETVGNLTHLTFFEMLGNFSFGDYFKAEAINMSWEFLISKEWLGLDPQRLAFTVFEEDDEAYGAWAALLTANGIDPSSRIFRLGEETNYWPAGAFSAGPPGPCGPNSEMFYWTSKDTPPPGITPNDYDCQRYLDDEERGLWLEIWNDVFIQYEWQGRLRNPERPNEGYEKGAMPELPFRSIDTGMGLERTTAVLAGFKSVYDTDVFAPIIETIVALGEKRFGYQTTDEKADRAIRIIADHIRTACFCIADGILPANSGRGYVLRRLIRRAVIKGQRTLGFVEPFFHRVYEGVAKVLGEHYTELIDRKETIVRTLHDEETLFRRTIARGIEMLENELAALSESGGKTLDGAIAFRLYDTFGFPLEVTTELCDEAGVSVETEAYESSLMEAQERSRQGSEMGTVYGGVVAIQFIVEDGSPAGPTEFLGYGGTTCDARIVAAISAPNDESPERPYVAIALDRTPFYSESGGQVSDTGVIEASGTLLKVVDVAKQDGVYVHLCEPQALAGESSSERVHDLVKEQESLNAALFDREVTARVDSDRRRAITRNHTATHLLHAALRIVLGKHVAQAGSLVAPEHLRFDFSHGKAMTAEEVAAVEKIVVEQILAAQPVLTYDGVPLEAARAMGAMALFGEKYADFVRVVQIGAMPPDIPSYSRELCGGIHVANTGEIGPFKIVHEGSAASGIRRISALTGWGAYEWVNEQSSRLHEAAEKLKTSPHDLVPSIEKTLDQLRDEKRKVDRLRTQSASSSEIEPVIVGAIELVVQRLDDIDLKEATVVVDRLIDNQPKRLVLAAVSAEGKVQVIAKAGPEALKSGAHAGNLVKMLAQQLGGGGGGRPDFATAGGRDVAKIDEALAGVVAWLKGQIGV